jgi:RHS repeat-associated protein
VKTSWNKPRRSLANGNLTSDGVKTYDWDAANHLISVKQGAGVLADFSYDGYGRRSTKSAAGVTTIYVYNGTQLLEERPSGESTKRRVYGPGIDNLLAQTIGGVVSYFIADHLGSVIRTTDASGLPVLTRDYDPWGNSIQGSGTSGPAFTGREWDAETGLYYYRARYYHRGLGRFISEDRAESPGQYVYANNNPIRFNDPLGLTSWDCTISVTCGSGPLQFGVCHLFANCESSCRGVRPREKKQKVYIEGRGAGATPGLRGGTTKSTYTLWDKQPRWAEPKIDVFQGSWRVVGAGVSLPKVGGGSATALLCIGEACIYRGTIGSEEGFEAGISIVRGKVTKVQDTGRECCDPNCQ